MTKFVCMRRFLFRRVNGKEGDIRNIWYTAFKYIVYSTPMDLEYSTFMDLEFVQDE